MKKSSLSKLFSTTLAILSFGTAIGIPQPSNSQVGIPQPSNSQTTAFNSAEVDQNKFVVAATYSPISNLYQLVIIEQISPTRSCWSESSRNPTLLNLLLLQFDFTGICGRATDSNGYSIRMGGQDLGVSYSFTFVRSGNDLVMVGSDPLNQNSPKIEIGRTNGLSQSPMKVNLNPGWRLTRRTFQGSPLGHIYLTNNRTLSQVIASGGVFTGSIAETGDGLGTGTIRTGIAPGTTGLGTIGGGTTGTETSTGGGTTVCITPARNGTTATGITGGVTSGSNSSGTATSGGTIFSRTAGNGTTVGGTAITGGTGTTGSGISGNQTTGSGVTSGSNPSGTATTGGGTTASRTANSGITGSGVTNGSGVTGGTGSTGRTGVTGGTGTTSSGTSSNRTTVSGVPNGSNPSGITAGGTGTTSGTGATGSGTTGAGAVASSGANVCVTPGSGTTGGGWNNR